MSWSKLAALALAALMSASLLACAEDRAGSQVSPQSAEALYAAAVEDSKQAEEDEILPLVTLTSDNDMVTWSSDGSKVLLLSWHDDPEAYAAQQIVVDDDGTWTFTDGEVIAWYAEFAAASSLEPPVTADSHEATDAASSSPPSTHDIDWNMTFEQLLGLPLDADYTHVSAMWVDFDEVIRPAYQPDVTQQLSARTLDGSALGDHAEWFWAYYESSYSDAGPYPWTRLGYTYDWADNGIEYGLTEFLVLPASTVEVEWTKSAEEFVCWLTVSAGVNS